uniref:COP9 signalosome complex subunit 8 n=1 Tax=Peronospora matthiolae TaxID=2874970 RepID=A0AAV1V477_9STRA
MQSRLDALQTQRHELLAAFTAASDRDTKQNIVQQLLHLSEELELVSAALVPSLGTATLSVDFYASYLVLVLLSKDLNDARFLWKRIRIEMKEASEELRNVWAIGRALWQRDLAAAFAAMDYDWSPLLQGLVEALKISTREATAELLSRAYSTIPVSDVALAMGFARHEDAVQYCLSMDWTVSEADQWVLPKPLANTRRGPSTGVDMAQLDTLSKTVLHLEQNTVAMLQ